GVRVERVGLVRAGDGDDTGVPGGVVDAVAAGVTGGRHHDRPLLLGIGNGVGQRAGGTRSGHADVEDPCAVVSGPGHAGGEVAERGAGAVVDLDRHELAGPAVGGDALTIVGGGPDDAGDLGAVTVGVIGVRRACQDVPTRDDLAGKVGV